MAKKVTATTEKYLKSIYRLQEKNGAARTSEIVKLLRVAPGTVTNTVKRLKRECLIRHKPHEGIKLTKKGRKIALYAIRKHLLIEKLLTDILRVEQTIAYEVAFNIGYSVPDSVIEKIEEALEKKQASITS